MPPGMQSRTNVAETLNMGAGRRPTIVFAISNFEPAFGGTVSQIGRQARALRRRGLDAIVLTKPHAPDLPQYAELDGLKVVRRGPAPATPDTSWSWLDKVRTLSSWTIWLLRHRRRIDAVQAVLHADLLGPPFLAGLSRRTGMLWVGRGDAERMLCSGTSLARRIVERLRRRLLRRAFHVVLTHAMANELISLRIPNPAVIPVPVDTHAFHPVSADERIASRTLLRLGRDEPIVLFVGHAVQEKGVHHLISAAALLRDAGITCRVLVVGEDRSPDRSYVPSLRGHAADLRLDASIRFEGFHRDIRRYLWAADVLVLPSEREGMPNVLLEAMACGTPCVAPASAGGDELLHAGGGVVPPSNSPEDLVQAIREVLIDESSVRRMSSAARRSAERFSTEDVAQSYARLYRAIIGQTGARLAVGISR